ncbi:MAG: universal stress protein [Planctomycetaceae bacterium]
MFSLQKILVPVDFSDFSMNALNYAVRLARKVDAKLFILHVASPVFNEFMSECRSSYKESYEDFEGRALTKVAQDLDNLLTSCPVSDAAQRAIRVGCPVSEITSFAEEEDIDMIVMGTHGRTGLSHLIIGSVAERTVREAHCPVLTVRTPTVEKEEAPEFSPVFSIA